MNLPAERFSDPGRWASEMEDAGWAGVCASDHFWIGENRYPHVFVTATRMACATHRIRLTTSFCNNLFRSPVEFAQAALALQEAADGRFEAGLGAGWNEAELVQTGQRFPPPGERVSRYAEALAVVRDLIRTGGCGFSGEHYQIDMPAGTLGPTSGVPPLLIASAGGPIAIRKTVGLVDRLEIKASSRATRGGFLDFTTLATIDGGEIERNARRAREARPGIPLSIFLLIAVGDSPMVRALKGELGESFPARFVGSANEVAEAIVGLEAYGIDRVQLTELVPGSHDALAEALAP